MWQVKKMLLRNYKTYISALLLFCSTVAGANAQGLMFNSNQSLLNKRTSYDVFNTIAPEFKDKLSLIFDLSLWDEQNLGYIFSLAGKKESYSLSYLYFNGAAYLNFNIDRKCNKLKILLSPAQLGKRKWIHIRADFDLQHDLVSIHVDGKTYQAGSLGLDKAFTPALTFGKNNYYPEVPNMAVKNLSVADDTKSFTFPLDEWKGNIAHSSTGESIGLIANPVWLINEAYFWKPVYSQSFKTVVGINFNPDEQTLIAFSKDSLWRIDSESGRANAAAFKNTAPLHLLLGKSIFNARENKLYAYEAYNDGRKSVNLAALNLNTLTWHTIGKAAFEQQRHHHNAFYNAAQDSIFLFGGYGSYTYYNKFYTYNQQADQWSQVHFKGDSITPRFFSAVGNSENKDEVFLLGGFGNESGNQVVGGKQYYDFYRINVKTHTIKKCWTIHPAETFVPANNLVLSKDKKFIYALCYPHEIFKTSIKLYKFSVKDGTYEVVSSPIAVTSERIESDINLFLNDKNNELLCAVQEFVNPDQSTIKIYSLAYPPISKNDYLRAKQLPAWYLSGWIYGLSVAGMLLMLSGFGLWYYRRKIKGDESPQRELQPEEIQPPVSDEPVAEPVYVNTIRLLGEFMVFNTDGKDITYLFSPKIKQLFVLILLHSKDGAGISSKKVSSVLWPDKDVIKTKNIRGVTFNHLRNAIGDIAGLELVYLNDTYVFKVNDDLFCDFYSVQRLLNGTAEQRKLLTAEQFALINQGTLLPDMLESWLDDFKLNYEEQIINLLVPELQKLYEGKSFKQALEMSKLVLSIDPFNDSGLKYQLKSYNRLKGIDHCKKVYEQYLSEYKKSFGVNYSSSLEKLLL